MVRSGLGLSKLLSTAPLWVVYKVLF